MNKIRLSLALSLSMLCVSAYARPWAPVNAVGAGAYPTGPSFHFSFAQANQPDICIGGGSCGLNVNAGFWLYYPTGTYVQKVIVRAHDDVGSHAKAHLQLWSRPTYPSYPANPLEGQLLGEFDVLKAGGEIVFNVYSYVGKLEFVSVNQDHLPGSDETVIQEITSY